MDVSDFLNAIGVEGSLKRIHDDGNGPKLLELRYEGRVARLLVGRGGRSALGECCGLLATLANRGEDPYEYLVHYTRAEREADEAQPQLRKLLGEELFEFILQHHGDIARGKIRAPEHPDATDAERRAVAAARKLSKHLDRLLLPVVELTSVAGSDYQQKYVLLPMYDQFGVKAGVSQGTVVAGMPYRFGASAKEAALLLMDGRGRLHLLLDPRIDSFDSRKVRVRPSSDRTKLVPWNPRALHVGDAFSADRVRDSLAWLAVELREHEERAEAARKEEERRSEAARKRVQGALDWLEERDGAR